MTKFTILDFDKKYHIFNNGTKFVVFSKIINKNDPERNIILTYKLLTFAAFSIFE